MKYILLLILLVIFNGLQAQTDFRSGKIITMEGDTLQGELNFQGEINNTREIEFRNVKIDSIYRPFEIDSYVFDNGKYYVSKTVYTRKDTFNVFAEYIVKGKKDLFFYRLNSGFHYAMSISSDEIMEIPYKETVVNFNGVNYQKESTHHIGYLKSYFQDCPSLFPEIDKLKSPDRRSLLDLTIKYHEINCSGESCIIYEKEKYPLRIAIEPIFTYYFKNYYTDDSSNKTFGTHLYFWLPNSSEKLYIKTGLLYTQLKDYNYYQIPFVFEYLYSYNTIKPKFDIGVNWHLYSNGGVGLTTLVSGGCLVKVTDWLFIDFDISSDLFHFSYETDFFLTLAARTGLYIKINNNNR